MTATETVQLISLTEEQARALMKVLEIINHDCGLFSPLHFYDRSSKPGILKIGSDRDFSGEFRIFADGTIEYPGGGSGWGNAEDETEPAP